MRYADGIMMHAKSMQDFVDMLELLFPEFAFVGV
jgi:hypothetical protein